MNSIRKQAREERRRISEDFSALKNPSGRQYSLEERRLLLAEIHEAMEIKGMDESQALYHIADISGADVSTLRALYSVWKSERAVPSPATAHMGKGNPSHPLHIFSFSMEAEC